MMPGAMTGLMQYAQGGGGASAGGGMLSALGGATGVGLGVSAIAGIAGGVLGSMDARKARKAQEERWRQMMALMAQSRQDTEQLYGQAGDAQRSAIKSSGTGFDRASGIVGQLGAASRSAVRDQGQQALGRGTQNLLSRGLAGSSAAGGLARGVAADTSRGLGQVNQGVAGAQSSLEAQRGMQEASLSTQLAEHYRRKAGALAAINSGHAGLMGQREDVAAPHWLSTIGAAGLNFTGQQLGLSQQQG